MTNNYLINGPNNVVRLINGDKILYIFGDIHLPTDYQHECQLNDDYDSIDLDKLLYKFMKNEKKKVFDLFIEDFKYYFITPEYRNTNRNRYIDQISKLFKSHILIENNKILTNKKYNNFKFHYFDIRDSIDVFNDFFYYSKLHFDFPYQTYDCKIISDNTLNIIRSLEYYLKNDYTDNIFIYKILNKYENKEIQIIINKIYNECFIKNIHNAIDHSKELLDLINQNIRKMYENYDDKEKYIDIVKLIYIKFQENQRIILHLTCLITDLYFLRRFLDKTYIKNGIIYTGLAHFADLTYLLIKYFNYELTHIYYTKDIKNIDKVSELKTDNLLYIKILLQKFTMYNELFQITQCVNLIHFPKDFS